MLVGASSSATLVAVAATVALAALSVPGVAAAAGCSSVTVRREFRQLSEGERQAYLTAVNTLKQRPPGGATDFANWNLDQFAKTHWDFQTVPHGTPLFLPWHRMFVHLYEQALRTIDPNVSAVFWDWSLDSQNPASSDIFLSSYFGGNGRAGDNCVVDGVAKSWATSYPPPGSPCLKRCSTWGALWGPNVMNDLTSQATTFGAFRVGLESNAHAIVHLQGGGTCGQFSTMGSVSDPLFFLHHTNVDRAWWKWQNSCNGYQQLYDDGAANPNDMMPPFNVRVSDVLDSGAMCYTYSKTETDQGFKPTCLRNKGPAQNNTGINSPTAWWMHTLISGLLPNVPSEKFARRLTAGKSLAEEAADLDPIKVVPDSPTKIIAPPSNDRSNLIHTRHPDPVPLEYAQKMRLDADSINQWNKRTKLVVDYYNNQEGYVSPAALVNFNKYNPQSSFKVERASLADGLVMNADVSSPGKCSSGN